MADNYPNLIETTTSEDIEPTYMKGVGVLDSDLTDVEKVVLKRSRRYVEMRRADRNVKLVKLARVDFEKLRDIPKKKMNGITTSTNKIREEVKIMRNKYDKYVNAFHRRSEKDSNRRDVICGNCDKMTNFFITDPGTGFIEGIYFYCPHCGELNRFYSV